MISDRNSGAPGAMRRGPRGLGEGQEGGPDDIDMSPGRRRPQGANVLQGASLFGLIAEPEPVMAADAELRRFEAERNIPAAASPGLPDDLLALQAGHRKARGDLAGDRTTKTLALVGMYLQRLENMRKNLTIAGRLDEALAVNAALHLDADAARALLFAEAERARSGKLEGLFDK